MLVLTTLALMPVVLAAAPEDDRREVGVVVGEQLDGYRGIWHGQEPTGDQYSYKYSGGLATYTAKQIPLAIHAPEVKKTFFVYGGTKAEAGSEGEGKSRLLACIGCFDHKTGMLTRPTLVHDKSTFDPHDNPSLSIDPQGYLWMFISGRGRGRAGWIYRSEQPYNIEKFRLVDTGEYTYPQPWYIPERGFLFLFTKYLGGRQLFFKTSPTGEIWGEDQPLAKFGGHYQLSWIDGQRVGTAFNWHPRGVVNDRTNLYYVETSDFGQTWQTPEGKTVELPLTETRNPALVHDFQADGLRVYLNDLKFTPEGEPVALIVTSQDWQPGPTGDPRTWEVVHFTEGNWQRHPICESDHNYDTGLIDVSQQPWQVIGPTQRGPQLYHTGGEVAVWHSSDRGKTWSMMRELTANSPLNHGYVRPVVDASDEFYALWSDGDSSSPSPCRLYFCDRSAEHVWRLPEHMEGETAAPQPMDLP